MSTAPETTKPKANLAALAVVVFGRDEAGKPHAAWFDQGEASLAEKAADLMGLRVLRVHTDEHRALASAPTIAGTTPDHKLVTLRASLSEKDGDAWLTWRAGER